MKNVAIIPESVEEKDALIRALLEENAQLKQQYFRVLEQFKLAQQRHFAGSSESNILQMELQFDEAEELLPEALPQEDNTITVTYTRGKPKRRTLPEDLPREVIEHDIPEHDKLCVCGCMKQRIGEEVTEQLEIIPAVLKVIAHVRPKYACNRCDEGVSIASMPKKSHVKPNIHPSNVMRGLEKSKPILDDMKTCLEQSLRHAVPQSKLESALNYMNQRWQQLTKFLLDGSLEIDNNGAENQIRPFAVGRKNWLFSGSPRGAQASALFYSLIATAVANGWNPFDYLRHLFENIRLCKTRDDYIRLLPFNINLINTYLQPAFLRTLTFYRQNKRRSSMTMMFLLSSKIWSA